MIIQYFLFGIAFGNQIAQHHCLDQEKIKLDNVICDLVEKQLPIYTSNNTNYEDNTNLRQIRSFANSICDDYDGYFYSYYCYKDDSSEYYDSYNCISSYDSYQNGPSYISYNYYHY